jgi:hypothetical protein
VKDKADTEKNGCAFPWDVVLDEITIRFSNFRHLWSSCYQPKTKTKTLQSSFMFTEADKHEELHKSLSQSKE